jgi:hypothetical protein
MIPGIEQTPPEVALFLGFFIALAIKRGRIEVILDGILPTKD